MPSVLYSTTCYVKRDLYQLSVTVDDTVEDSPNTHTEVEASSSMSSEILPDSIKPSLTRITFSSVRVQNITSVPSEIPLNYLLSVQHMKTITANDASYFNDANTMAYVTPTVTPSLSVSRRTSAATMSTNIDDNSKPSTPSKVRRPSGLGRFFSSQRNSDCDADVQIEKCLRISYVDTSNSLRWEIKRIMLEVDSEDLANELYVNLNICLSALVQRPHNLLAFINPFGGKGRAKVVYDKSVLPIFKEANITVDSIYTERANQAKDHLINTDLSKYDGVVCVGGDGMFAELCHGLLLRTSTEANLNINDPQVEIVQPSLRIGIIPAGSTDAIVFGTTGLNDPVTSTLQIILGETLPIDIATVHNETGFVRFMASMLAYGFFGDIIEQSDRWRFLGPLRYDLAGFCRLIRNRSYHAELTITLSGSEPAHGVQPASSVTNNESDSSFIVASQLPADNNTAKSNENSLNDISTKLINRIRVSKLVFCKKNCEKCAKPGRQDSHRTDSKTIIKREGKYTTINCLNMPCRCAKSRFGMSPYVHLGDGTFDLVLVKRSLRRGFIRFLWQVANDGRSIEHLPYVERYRVSEVFVRPKNTDREPLGNWACDGELIFGNEIRIRIHRQKLNLFASGIQLDKIEEYNQAQKKRKTKRFSCFCCRKRQTDDNE